MTPKPVISKRSLSPQNSNMMQNQMSHTTENYYMQNMRGNLPSTNSIETPKNNMAQSMRGFRKESDQSPTKGSRGRKVVGSERFDMKGTHGQNSHYKAHNPDMPFRNTSNENRFARHGLTSKSTSTSLNKYSFHKGSESNINLNDSSTFTGHIKTSIGQGGTERKPSGHNVNPMSMEELRDLDVSPEKR